MRAFAVIAVAATLAGCTSSSQTQSSSSATITHTVTETVGDVNDPLARHAVAPPLSLETAAGTVRATQGSSCVEYTDPDTGEGSSVCGDTPYPAPEQLVVVRPHERVRFHLRGGRGFVVDVHRLGCHRHTLQRVRVPASGTWRVNVRPGLYELFVFVQRFRIGARHGDTSGGFGLWVSRRRPRDIVPAASVYAPGC